MPHSDGTRVENTEEQIAELARRVTRLSPDHRDPHRFHEEKSEIAYQLSKIARSAGR